jgi:hypothetical protein
LSQTEVFVTEANEVVEGTVVAPTAIVVTANQTVVEVADTEATATVQENALNLSVAPSGTTVAVAVPTVEVIAVGMQGPQGIQGPVGATGAPGATGAMGLPGLAGGVVVFTQSTPSASWTINHNLGFIPEVVVLDSANDMVEGDIDYVNNDTLILTFSAAFAGTAYVQ